MSSIFSRFPDFHFLLSLHSEELAFLFLGYFRSLPWTIRRAVNECVRRGVELYPEEVRGRLHDALMDAWDSLERSGLLGSDALPVVAPTILCLKIMGTRFDFELCFNQPDHGDEAQRTDAHRLTQGAKGD